ncbi:MULTISPECIES: fimbrial protein [Stenotrophomonas]|jgi:major type 1 subunit fimbrin (pilin)|uniref:fimbrial protein n=1 Tax=Stenotrophomonas TaxID=40323 RepID=UPI00066BDA77|nr:MULTISPECIES: fimbrial protein [Stenotrophomonas]MBA0351436.1 type 1 fimbrial protein [Stenotrophomonas maltophilia]MBH1693353.1 type 1 fimbrial protein [Stenotrophomonas maltophilia]MBH1818222.1 type 1 fimbrial protein [Stenotrophomonas maltophilia]MCU1029533.1 type 1 fimbrial protein [Stenotrophomonas maltophilia]MDH0549666.1 type 1 fimbrial protein [Stenotrophomonas sp. GD04006]
MNKLAIALSAALSLGAVASANAADATISFSGAINATSCSVGFAGVASGPLRLATVTKATVESGTESSRTTPFTLEVGSTANTCPAGTMEVKFVDPSGSVDGKIGNTAASGAATNVAVELIHKDEVLTLGVDTIDETRATAGVYQYVMQARYLRPNPAVDVVAGDFVGSVGVELTLR